MQCGTSRSLSHAGTTLRYFVFIIHPFILSPRRQLTTLHHSKLSHLLCRFSTSVGRLLFLTLPAPAHGQQKSAATPQAGSAGGSSKGKKFADCYKTGKTVSIIVAFSPVTSQVIPALMSALDQSYMYQHNNWPHTVVATHLFFPHTLTAWRGCVCRCEAGHQEGHFRVICHQDCDQGQADRGG